MNRYIEVKAETRNPDKAGMYFVIDEHGAIFADRWSGKSWYSKNIHKIVFWLEKTPPQQNAEEFIDRKHPYALPELGGLLYKQVIDLMENYAQSVGVSEEEYNKFLKWVETKTTFFIDKDVTIDQIVREYLATQPQPKEEEKKKCTCGGFPDCICGIIKRSQPKKEKKKVSVQNAEKILDQVFKEERIRKAWTTESKNAVIKAMERFASERDSIINEIADSVSLLNSGKIEEAKTTLENVLINDEADE
jgi:soluble cytochrome b562